MHSNALNQGGFSHTALRNGCESFCHVFDYFLAWSGIFEIFDVVFVLWNLVLWNGKRKDEFLSVVFFFAI